MQGHYFFESDLFFLPPFTSAISLPSSLFLLILFLNLFAVFVCLLFFICKMAGYSSGASYKQHSPSKASVLGEEEHRRRRHHHHSHEESYNRDQRYHQVFNIACKKVPSFNGDSDPNVYLEWETKVDHYFHVYKVQDDDKLRIVSSSFLGYAKEWWHKIVMDIIYRKKPPVVSWNALKECMRARFVPPSRKEHLLKFQRLPQGHRMVDEYFKDFETTLTKMNMHANEESKIKWFVRGLRKDIREFVELNEYSSLKNHTKNFFSSS